MKFHSFLTLFLILVNSTLGEIEVNEQVPEFKAINSEGKTWESQKILGQKKLLLYFYPAAMTGGCTKQACAYRNDLKKWKELGVEVVGISGDQPSNLSLFKQAEKINFTLLSDPTGKIARIFDVPIGKGGMIERFIRGDKYTLERGVTLKRWTFLISQTGKLLYKNNQVNAIKDSENVMKFLKSQK
jgi:peroxiredoxin Q/BCP